MIGTALANTSLDDPASDALVRDLIATRPFRRLKGIAFLGAFGYAYGYRHGALNVPLGGSRYDHSWQVMLLAWRYCREFGLSPQRCRPAIAAALLHDIGHLPLSHSAEPFFRETFGIDHHTATTAIISGTSPLGAEIAVALRTNGVDLEEVLALVAGRTEDYHGLFAVPITLDTIEGVTRCADALGDGQTPRAWCVTDAATRRFTGRDRAVVDAFWRRKERVYATHIHSPLGVLSDQGASLLLAARRAGLAPDICFFTDRALFRALPTLRSLFASPALERRVLRMAQGEVTYRSRSYTINEHEDFFGGDDRKRYLTARAAASITSPG